MTPRTPHAARVARLLLYGAAALLAACGSGDRGASEAAASASAPPASSARAASSGAGAPPASASAGAAPPSAGGHEPLAPPPVEVAEIDPPPDAPPDPLGAVGARARTIVAASDEVALEKNPALFRRHFGGPVPLPLEVREAKVGAGRRALLFTGGEAVRPLVVVVDAAGQALWQKGRPLAGTHEEARGLTIAAGPEGSVLVFWWDVASRAVAGRRWGHDGSIFADFHFFDREDVTGLDALHWPGHGWLVTATSGGRAATALLQEDGFRGFGDRVLDVSGAHEVLAPAVAAAGTDGVFVAYVGRPRGAGGAADGNRRDRAQLWVTFRRDDGAPAWPAPIALGAVVAEEDGSWPRPRIDLLTPARARVTAGHVSGVIGSDGRRVTTPR